MMYETRCVQCDKKIKSSEDCNTQMCPKCKKLNGYLDKMNHFTMKIKERAQ